MKIVRSMMAVLLVAGAAWALQGKPINDKCPIKGEPVDSQRRANCDEHFRHHVARTIETPLPLLQTG